jgi:hypothetical protein
MRTLLGTIVAALVVTGAASAGGWATAGLGPPSGGIGPGDTWNAVVTVLQHGQTPLVGVKPTVIIRGEDGQTLTFPARPTGKPGVYLAKVKFPSSGTWRYQVYDGFTQYGNATTHSFPPVQIGPDVGGSSFPLLPSLGGVALALIAAAVVVFFIRRGRRTAPVPA